MFTLLTFNILRDGLYEAGDRRETIRQVMEKHAPDLVCMQEGGDDRFWSEFAHESGYYFINSVGEYRPATFSRYPIIQSTVSHENVGLIYSRLDVKGTRLGVYNVHLPQYLQWEAERIWFLEIVMKMIEKNGDPNVCIAGDFNSSAQGDEVQEWGLRYALAVRDDGREGQSWQAATDFMSKRGFIDCYRSLHTDLGLSIRPSLDGLRRWCPELIEELQVDPEAVFGPAWARLDRIYVNSEFHARLVECDIDNSASACEASDHLPFVARFDC